MAVFVQVPEVATTVVFRRTPEGDSDLIVTGPRTRGRYHPLRLPTTCVRVPVRPSRVRAALGVSPERLVNRAVRLTDLWGGAAVDLAGELAAFAPSRWIDVDRLAQPRDAFPDRLRPHSLPGHLPQPPADDPALERVAAIRARISAELERRGGAQDGGEPKRRSGLRDGGELVEFAIGELTGTTARLGEVAARAGVSERRLRTLFTRDVGLSPKHVARIGRLRTVLTLAGTRGWAAVADDAGFFDQAHMISDFRALMGVPPAAYLNGRTPGPTPCVPLSAGPDVGFDLRAQPLTQVAVVG
ncbi:helix-turn-helix domain-containing protein [Actinoplanes sp. Pm04-4]|uniref:Helix-turn-helix domain-containing protein n=1 Tax=Paractinoplanes pyxinae TaxID=2997416 RepID=A0ABT4B5F9_9ACTN|nr:helix-turn-helix domain-containing protein [Actinoplanes pyxinae]MCY1141740.1 helix-turn-helix domain-containing protein [Actinoplanes pyxinae]